MQSVVKTFTVPNTKSVQKIRPTQEPQFNASSPQQLKKVHMIISNKISGRQKNI